VSSRDRDFRPSRRRDFDDDSYQPPTRNFGYAPPRGPQFDSPSGPSVRATVKWYNPDKGFGFVELADGSGDAFLHVSVVERGGHGSVPPGATLEARAAGDLRRGGRQWARRAESGQIAKCGRERPPDCESQIWSEYGG